MSMGQWAVGLEVHPDLFLFSFLRILDIMFLSLVLVSVKQSQNNGSDGASQNIIDYVSTK